MSQEENSPSSQNEAALELRFSHNIIEHLGLKLYQNRPTNVLAELVSNSWDADAKNVWIDLLTNQHGSPSAILVGDDGSGMSVTDLSTKYLIVGHPKRDATNPSQQSAGYRYLMGRKGIGKLAPFGVAREIDLITVQSGRVTWLRFDYGAMLDESEAHGELAHYAPTVFARDTSIDEVKVEGSDHAASISKFFGKIEASKAGTLVMAKNLTIKRSITPDTLKQSLGRRFTVTLTRPDFQVSVNDELVSEKDAFPEWELRIPPSGSETFKVQTPQGEKEVKCWAGFVKSAAWSAEEAGVGIYAHGKIAQDRPFFFGNKGKEVFSRYMYAVVEADWVDEFNHDAISTDRTSVNWDDDDLAGLRRWGEDKTRAWLTAYEKHRKKEAEKENLDLVNQVVQKDNSLSVSSSEREHLVSLLADVTPRLGKEEENREKLVEATVRAWIHEPARKLIKKLWEEAATFDADNFAFVVRKLADQLIPESLSLAVIFSQRVFALTQLERHIMHGKETQLQKLLEEFPWILDNSYEAFYPRRALKTLCDEAEAQGLFQNRNVHLPENVAFTKPDFVFLGDASETKILVVELKGPDDTAAFPEYQQLHAYMSYLKSRYARCTVYGILVARSFDEGIEDMKTQTMSYLSWPDLLKRSRRDHMHLLAALLAGTEADARDARVQQICELGGTPVKEFLDQMAQHSEELRELTRDLAVVQQNNAVVGS